MTNDPYEVDRSPGPSPEREPDAPDTGPRPWPFWKGAGFRFLAVYFVLYTLPFPLSYIPWIGGKLSMWTTTVWKAITPWVGEHILRLEGEMFLGMTGSGDTTFDFVKLLIHVVLAVLAALVWTAFALRRQSHDGAARWLVVGCRYYLGIVMLGYGFAKVIKTQFPAPGLSRLLTPYGESSPMGLVWTFMGFSPGYTIFAGLGEAIGGLLLFWARTRAIGAVLLIAVMGNVVMINFCYDVPVKLFSLHLLLMAIAILLLDARRMMNVFLLNRPAPAADLRPLFSMTALNIGAKLLGLTLVGFVLYGSIAGNLEAYRTFGDGRPRPPLWGVYDVERFVRDGAEVPALMTDHTRWRALIVDRPLPMKFGEREFPGTITVQQMSGVMTHHPVVLDTDGATFQFLLPQADGTTIDGTVLGYERPEPYLLVLRGTWGEGEVEIHLRERDLDSTNLVGRGFHWINEMPNSR